MKKFWILTFIFVFQYAHALVPLENIVLGNFSEEYIESYSDPLDYLFEISDEKTNMENQGFKNKLAIYRGFYEEGRNLEQYCRDSPGIRYREKWQREQTKLSFAATLQFIGLDVTSRAISKYSKELGYSEDQYNNLVENIVGNYCSRNTSVISLKQLKTYFESLQKKNEYTLPSLEGSPLFSYKLGNLKPQNQIYQEELKATILLFKSFCSWGTALDNYRLMTPLVRNPIIASFIIRQMASQTIGWDATTSQVFLKTKADSTKVACRGLICRKVKNDGSSAYQIKGIGYESYSNDLKRLYCQDIRDAQFKTQGETEVMKGWQNEMTLDLQNLLVGQFTALVTGFPDFSFRVDNFTDYIRLAKLGIDLRWENWANLQIKNSKKDMYYEEPLTIEIVDRELFFVPERKNFQVVIDVNLGEFDRTNQLVGKISSRFHIKLKKAFIRMVQRRILAPNPLEPEQEKNTLRHIQKVVEDQILASQAKLSYSPWAKGLPRLISVELYRQFQYYSHYIYNSEETGVVEMPVVMNYAPFALKYIHELYRANVSSAKGKATSAVQDKSP